MTEGKGKKQIGPRFTATLLVFLGAAAVLLVYEHRAHVFTGTGALIALLALCVGMHLFMHGGHGGHGGHGSDGHGDRDRGHGDGP